MQDLCYKYQDDDYDDGNSDGSDSSDGDGVNDDGDSSGGIDDDGVDNGGGIDDDDDDDCSYLLRVQNCSKGVCFDFDPNTSTRSTGTSF